MRKIDRDDITWRDTAFLSKFMNDTGKILNKYQTRLATATHRKVAKTIKHVRDLEVFAHVGLVKPTDRIPVGSFIEDLEEMHKKTIDPVTGRMFLKHSMQDELRVKNKRIFGTLEKRFEGLESSAEHAQDEEVDTKEKVLRELALETSSNIVPDRSQRKWLIAQAHIVERDGGLEEEADSAKLEGREFVRPAVEFLGSKEAYQESVQKLEEADVSPSNLFTHFINEKSLNVQTFDKAPAKAEVAKQLKQVKVAIDEDEDESEIRKRIKQIMSDYGNSNYTEGRGIADHEYEADPAFRRSLV
jgi:ribosomal protein S18